MDGRGVERDPEKAAEYFQKALDSPLKDAPALARLDLARLYFRGECVAEDKARAKELIQEALADERRFAVSYDSPDEPKRDEDGALPGFPTSDAKASASSANGLGVRYFAGLGVEKNLAEARKWFQVASLYGNSVATNNLAFCRAAGWGVEKDAEKALETALDAAGSNEPISTFPFVAPLNVEGVEGYRAEALAWLKDAASNGDERAKEALGLFE